MIKVVRYLGKILSPQPGKVTSDLSCCCGCLCCGLTRLEFTIESIIGIGILYNIIQDPDCPYSQSPGNNPEGKPGSAYSLYVSTTGGVLGFYLTLYCDNTKENTFEIFPENPSNFSIVSGKPSGTGKFVPVGLPDSFKYVCRITGTFSADNDTAILKFNKVPVVS